MTRPLAPVVLLVALVASACGGGDDEGITGTDAGPSFSEEDAQAAADLASLTLDDFPTGWVSQTPDPDEADLTGLPSECQAFIDTEHLPGRVADNDSNEFVGPNDESVQSSSTVYENEEAAKAAFNQIRQFIDDCEQPMEDAYVEFIERELAKDEEVAALELQVRDFKLGLVSFPEYGDESLAIRFDTAFESPELSFDVIVDLIGTRVGNVSAGIDYQIAVEPPDTALQERLLEIIEQRATGAAASLK